MRSRNHVLREGRRTALQFTVSGGASSRPPCQLDRHDRKPTIVVFSPNFPLPRKAKRQLPWECRASADVLTTRSHARTIRVLSSCRSPRCSAPKGMEAAAEVAETHAGAKPVFLRLAAASRARHVFPTPAAPARRIPLEAVPTIWLRIRRSSSALPTSGQLTRSVTESKPITGPPHTLPRLG